MVEKPFWWKLGFYQGWMIATPSDLLLDRLDVQIVMLYVL